MKKNLHVPLSHPENKMIWHNLGAVYN